MKNFGYVIAVLIVQVILAVGVGKSAPQVEHQLRAVWDAGEQFPDVTRIAFQVVPFGWVIPVGLCLWCVGAAMAGRQSAIPHGVHIACVLFMIVLALAFFGYTAPLIPNVSRLQ